MKTLRIEPQKTPLTGTVTVPGDKSLSHRAVMLGAIADGVSKVRKWLPAGDTIATLEIIQALGIDVQIDKHSSQAWDLVISGRGLHGLQPSADPLDSCNAGTCIRLFAGILGGQTFPSILDGSEQLRSRPMRRIITPLQQMGANITGEDNRAPLHIQPAPLHGIDYDMPVASGQVKSAVLLAGLYASGTTRVHEPGPARDHTERLLSAMGADIHWANGTVELKSGNSLSPLDDIDIPGDISSAAFLLVAGTIVPHSQITLTNVGTNDTRVGILTMLKAMGASISENNQRMTSGEPVADLTVQFDELHSTTVRGGTVVRGIDELPIWAVAATQSAGTNVLHDAAELRVKEVDRISRLAGELQRLGVAIREHDDGFVVDGPGRVQGNHVDSHGDHRLGMALAIAGLVANSPTHVHHADCIADSFPGFAQTLQTLGADVQWV